MNDYILWVMRDNERHVLVQFENEVYEDRIQQVQKEFVLNGYMVREVRQDCARNRRTFIEFYKADGEKDYNVRAREGEIKEYDIVGSAQGDGK